MKHAVGGPLQCNPEIALGIVVYWLEGEGEDAAPVCEFFGSKELTQALACAEGRRRQGHHHVSISTQLDDHVGQAGVAAVEGGRGVVSIEDQGGAAPPGRVEHALEPFVEKELLSASGAAPRRRERLGIGLAVARGILEAHGGGLDVSATPLGLTLRCELGPVVGAESADPLRMAAGSK